ncbi:hypothetical protein [Phenylobacterium sp.]|uniref:hypothetical protein n=1 Tax=Phenylobacterium sp. TaxID=1871053 RepID=UPI00273564A9|nr:hypothetical protein [Phenylobacterium sp.]MDP3853706.1 hypothetical protein [Phenylobacterium sp.]
MTYFSTRTKLAALALAGLALAGPATAAEPKIEGRAAQFQGLLDCKVKTDSAERLACYDAAVGALAGAEQKGDIVVVDREQAKAVRRQAFGFNLPSLAMFERTEKPEEIDRMTGQVAEAYRGGDGKWVFELEGGAVWAQTDSETLGRRPGKGSKVEVRKAAMGSYFLNSDGQRAVRARRVK